jgi:hypothetical protein
LYDELQAAAFFYYYRQQHARYMHGTGSDHGSVKEATNMIDWAIKFCQNVWLECAFDC